MREFTFQFHVTLQNLEIEQKNNFLELCNKEYVKPLLIELPEGKYIRQPMFTKLVKSNDFGKALNLINKLARKFEENKFQIARIKGEIISEDSCYFQVGKNGDFQPYYEWHCKVMISSITEIVELCHKYDAHLSANSLEGDSRYITIREYDSELSFYEKVEKFHEILERQEVTILKQKFEYCIYDNSLELDKGWAY